MGRYFGGNRTTQGEENLTFFKPIGILGEIRNTFYAWRTEC